MHQQKFCVCVCVCVILIWIMYLKYVPVFCLIDVCFLICSSIAGTDHSLPHAHCFPVRLIWLFCKPVLQVSQFLSYNIPTLPHFIPPYAVPSHCIMPVLLKGLLQNVFTLFFFFTASCWLNSFNVFCDNSTYGTRLCVWLCQNWIVLLVS